METLKGIFVLLTIIISIHYLFKLIAYKFGVRVGRWVWRLLVFTGLISQTLQGDLIWIAIFSFVLLVEQYGSRERDERTIGRYKYAQGELDKLCEQGWANVPRAVATRILLWRLWKSLPKNKQDELDKWEKSLEKNLDNPPIV